MDILDDVMKVADNISPLSVVILILISLAGAVVLTALCGCGLEAVRRLWNKVFRQNK